MSKKNSIFAPKYERRKAPHEGAGRNNTTKRSMAEILDPIPTEEAADAAAQPARETETPAPAAPEAEVAEETTAAPAAAEDAPAPAPSAPEADAEGTQPEHRVYADREEVLARLAEIAGETTDEAKAEINHLKSLYYRLRQQEADAELQALLESDDPEAAANYQAQPDTLEPRLKELLNVQREARAAMVEARQKEQAANLAFKQDLLNQMEALAQDAGDVNQHYNAFIELQKRFKEAGPVDPQEVGALWQRYTKVGEQFYDLLKINKELRDYDFRKNLEKKEQLIQEAEGLAAQDGIIAAFRRLQELHEEWKGIGPVAPALREEVWARFKAASTVINKRHQDHFDRIKAQETANEAGKTALIEQMEAIDTTALRSVKEWDTQTAAVLALQQEWRKLGAAPRKVNTQLYERYRRACDAFFGAKADFYKAIKAEQNANLEKKLRLCEKAEEMKDSTEWRKTADRFVSLQKEWKTIGAVPRKHANTVWQRFSAACDAFFAAKEQAVGGERAVERENLGKKEAILARLSELKEHVETATQQAVRDLMAEWNEVGHVPFKEKDRLFAEYKEKIDFFFDKLDMKGTRARMDNFRQNIAKKAAAAGEAVQSALADDRQKLVRAYDRLTADLKTYENNLGFFAKSSKPNPLLAQMEKKRDALKAEIAEIIAKIREIDKASAEEK